MVVMYEERKMLRINSQVFTLRRRDPEDRVVNTADEQEKRDKMFDKTGADSFPASDPPSSLPDPSEDSFQGAVV
jgi:hypothetical protein